MTEADYSHSEAFLQWIWSNLHFQTDNLRTCRGDSIDIIAPGQLNGSDGPDFLHASIRMGGLRLHGAVEIHRRAEGWREHGHHKDTRYNSVILHVVYHNEDAPRALRSDGTSIPTLELAPVLPEALLPLVEKFEDRGRLPCRGHLHAISSRVFQQQLDKARKKYFEAKADALLKHYPPEAPPSKAWSNALSIGLFDALGIRFNRAPMRQLATKLLEQPPHRLPGLQRRALELAGFQRGQDPPLLLNWNRKGSRPANRPVNRIRQGCVLMHRLLKASPRDWLLADPAQSWRTLSSDIEGLGAQRRQVLYGTVWLPGLYLLGHLFAAQQLQKQSWAAWKSLRIDLPNSIIKQLDNTPLKPEIYRRDPAAVFQIKHYCRGRRCRECEVLKNVISS